ncbi:isoprenylcysteine carboxylmethyltransferase family protein [Candidatus Nitronereus thalassa]|uniref:Isoprenylcysteine carboxylmethyltransferase family protein n=1 Tax=Candidatus Nitronereus thalassa TaxID=3020898 RepID=A0ABU3KDH5_9BACT|nr:isoprenylcysteine carboxylmethyltransferase family protein [Candidatus Nitronereus thalassa]MDT7044229.1 isoprenylcysteine carboxylmethyltransferase family protein [Candidatus Nitronereus thalassa]
MYQSKHQVQSYIFVGVQFICLGLLVVTGPWLASIPGLVLLEMSGVVLGLWAVLTMKLRHLSAFPEIKASSSLQSRGPYRWIRHPMYLALLMVTLAIVWEEFSYVRGGVWMVLFIDLMLKLQYEERLLEKTFPDFQDYQTRTFKLLPWIW